MECSGPGRFHLFIAFLLLHVDREAARREAGPPFPIHIAETLNPKQVVQAFGAGDTVQEVHAWVES